MKTLKDLQRALARIDGRGYKAYKDLQGAYDFGAFCLYVDHVQADPYAAPSRLRLRSTLGAAGFPRDLFSNRIRRLALEDFVARRVHRALAAAGRQVEGSGQSGRIRIDAGGPEVLERTACRLTPDWVEARITAGLPAAGRRVLGRRAEAMLCRQVPRIVAEGLRWQRYPAAEAVRFVECIENQEHIRRCLPEMGLVAFLADGAVLPRESGTSQRPLPRANRNADAQRQLSGRGPEQTAHPGRGRRGGAVFLFERLPLRTQRRPRCAQTAPWVEGIKLEPGVLEWTPGSCSRGSPT